jgi:hypothetical protein
MFIAGSTEYTLDPKTGTATSMNGGVMPVTTMLNVPLAAVVPLAVRPVLSFAVTAAPASGFPVAAVPVIVWLVLVVVVPPVEVLPVEVLPVPDVEDAVEPEPQPARTASVAARKSAAERLENSWPRQFRLKNFCTQTSPLRNVRKRYSAAFATVQQFD